MAAGRARDDEIKKHSLTKITFDTETKLTHARELQQCGDGFH